MTLRNRVTPDAQIVADNWRGTFMGNRGGRIHDPESRMLLSRKWASKRWICCVLSFKNRQRTVMGNGYTELFFLDEVSALAAGHRPCFECRRADANRFVDAWETVFGKIDGSRADAMDAALHQQRTARYASLNKDMVDRLPNASMIKTENGTFARKDSTWMLWSGHGYEADRPDFSKASLLTPPAIVEVLRHGYRPVWHESAM